MAVGICSEVSVRQQKKKRKQRGKKERAANRRVDWCAENKQRTNECSQGLKGPSVAEVEKWTIPHCRKQSFSLRLFALLLLFFRHFETLLGFFSASCLSNGKVLALTHVNKVLLDKMAHYGSFAHHKPIIAFVLQWVALAAKVWD